MYVADSPLSVAPGSTRTLNLAVNPESMNRDPDPESTDSGGGKKRLRFKNNPVTATLALVGLLGPADDWLNARTGDGISAIQKLLWQTVVAGVVAWQIQDTYQIDELAVPFIGAVGIHPIAFILIAAFAIVASSNAVNITDGLDGLATFR